MMTFRFFSMLVPALSLSILVGCSPVKDSSKRNQAPPSHKSESKELLSIPKLKGYWMSEEEIIEISKGGEVTLINPTLSGYKGYFGKLKPTSKDQAELVMDHEVFVKQAIEMQVDPTDLQDLVQGIADQTISATILVKLHDKEKEKDRVTLSLDKEEKVFQRISEKEIASHLIRLEDVRKQQLKKQAYEKVAGIWVWEKEGIWEQEGNYAMRSLIDIDQMGVVRSLQIDSDHDYAGYVGELQFEKSEQGENVFQLSTNLEKLKEGQTQPYADLQAGLEAVASGKQYVSYRHDQKSKTLTFTEEGNSVQYKKVQPSELKESEFFKLIGLENSSYHDQMNSVEHLVGTWKSTNNRNEYTIKIHPDGTYEIASGLDYNGKFGALVKNEETDLVELSVDPKTIEARANELGILEQSASMLSGARSIAEGKQSAVFLPDLENKDRMILRLDDVENEYERVQKKKK